MRTGFMRVIAVLLIATILAGDWSFAADVTVDGATRYQTIEGFGTCLIAWSGRFRELYRTEEFQKIYVERLGLNMLRVNMWGPTFEKPTEDFRQIRCEDFDMEADGARPEPIQKGIGNALHNALAAGNCSAFVPWQVTENRKSTHCIMLMSECTPKTYTAMHYSRFIRPGARRIDARPGFGNVQVSAFLHEVNGELAVVAINTTERQQALNLTFTNLKRPAALKVYRTSASENMQQAGEAAVSNNKTAFRMTPRSIVAFYGKI